MFIGLPGYGVMFNKPGVNGLRCTPPESCQPRRGVGTGSIAKHYVVYGVQINGCLRGGSSGCMAWSLWEKEFLFTFFRDICVAMCLLTFLNI
jgi:hypothetical protein